MNSSPQWLLFRRGRQAFAIAATQHVCQLSSFACAVLPDAPDGVTGLFSYAGEALPMIDMAAVAGELADPASNCLVVTIDVHQQLGLLSDDVALLTDTLPEQDLQAIADNRCKILTSPLLNQLLNGAAD